MARHLEDDLQEACVRWFSLQYPQYAELLHHSPNGGKRNAKEGAKFKRMGVRPGFADLILLVPRRFAPALFIELKVGKGKQTENQNEFEARVKKQGYRYVVCWSLEEFMFEIQQHLNGM